MTNVEKRKLRSFVILYLKIIEHVSSMPEREREREPVATIEYQKKSYNFLAINSY